MSIVVRESDPRAMEVSVSEDEISVFLSDGRRISVPLAWSWRLSNASHQERQNYQLIGDGLGISWPDIDEDISVEGMLRGIPAKRPGTGKPASN
ncbi:DUF2442 domain-containing protein [Desulfonatronovibrio magnus]|uniref:DUF2442 domain-containing protein n=1 Tax=Desulfonatronovibrio magnus TaxID=698827 RepID=UPI0005EB7697|nr:DUF2442 domain-containing protein [Desulfonatronovibrio magnus]RQD65491.1 MAG: DUF2442 domain-containing protein [Desulfonatronovibrio sp. MSAO_Bac4]